MIARNEEASIGEALGGACDFFTQIVVVDTGSTDHTAEIARKAGAEVYPFEWVDDFSAARNESIRHARGKWIFWMDADDTLSLASAEALIQDALSAPQDVGALIVPSQSIGANGVASTRVDHAKLFRNLPGIRFEGRIHEQVLPSIEVLGLRWMRSGAVVLHAGYDLGEVGLDQKRARDWRIMQLELQERPNHPFVLFNAAMIARFSNRYEEALEFTERAIAESEARGLPPLRKADVLRVEALRELKREDEALAAAFEGLNRVGGDGELHFHAGTLLTIKGRFREALAHFEVAAQAPIRDLSSVDASMLAHKLWHNTGAVCLRLGKYAEAKRWLMRAIEEGEVTLPSVQLLFMAALQSRDSATAQQLLDRVERQEGPSETWSSLFLTFEEATKGPGAGERALRKYARAHPESPGPRLAICQHMLRTGRAPEALRDLAVMAESGVPDAAFYIAKFEEQSGEIESAIEWMRLARELNPGHPLTEAEVRRLEGLMASA
jgi:tetratricopeptide (TPR) repeat protein